MYATRFRSLRESLRLPTTLAQGLRSSPPCSLSLQRQMADRICGSVTALKCDCFVVNHRLSPHLSSIYSQAEERSGCTASNAVCETFEASNPRLVACGCSRIGSLAGVCTPLSNVADLGNSTAAKEKTFLSVACNDRVAAEERQIICR